jgi:hypothetical protein
MVHRAGAQKFDVIIRVETGDDFMKDWHPEKKVSPPLKLPIGSPLPAPDRMVKYWNVACEGDFNNAIAQIAPKEEVRLLVARPPKAHVQAIESNQIRSSQGWSTDSGYSSEFLFIKFTMP